MLRPFTFLIALTALLGACGLRDSRVNPINWFGRDRAEPVAVAAAPDEINPLIPTQGGLFNSSRPEIELYLGTPVATITELNVDRVPGGAIIRATGVDNVQGLYEVQLTPEDENGAIDGVLGYRLEARRPENARAGGAEATRRVTAAVAVTDQELSDVHTIRVSGLENARSSRRR